MDGKVVGQSDHVPDPLAALGDAVEQELRSMKGPIGEPIQFEDSPLLPQLVAKAIHVVGRTQPEVVKNAATMQARLELERAAGRQVSNVADLLILRFSPGRQYALWEAERDRQRTIDMNPQPELLGKYAPLRDNRDDDQRVRNSEGQ